MRKNMIRKSLAVAAAGALTVMGMAVPASAAFTSMTITPLKGSSTNGLLGAYYSFKVAAKGATDETVSVVLGGVAEAEVGSVYAYNVTLADITDGIANIAADEGTDVSGDLADNADDSAYFEWDLEAGKYLVVQFSLDTAEIDDTQAVALQAFQDSDSDGIFDEEVEDGIKSAVKSVSFLNTEDVTGTVSVTPENGSNDGDVSVTINNVNMASIAEDADAMFNVVATYKGDEGAAVDFDEADYDSDSNAFVQEGTDLDDGGVMDNFETGKRVYVKAYFLDSTDYFAAGSGSGQAGQADVESVDDITIDNQVGILVDGLDVTARAGAGTFSVTTSALDGDDAAVAGATVLFTISESDVDTLDADATVKAGGKTLSNEDDTTEEDISVAVVADADGVATLTLTYADLADTDEFEITAAAYDADGIAQASVDTVAVVAEASEVDSVVLVNNIGSDYLAIKTGSNVSVQYRVIDQFGQTPDLTMRATWEASGGAMLVDKTDIEAVSTGGTFTAAWKDNSDDEDEATVEVTEVEYKDADGDWQVTGIGSDVLTLNVLDSIPAVAELEIDAIADGQSMELAEVAIQDERVATWAAANDLTGFEAIATATDADGVFVGGVPVTFSGAGLYFSSNEDVYAAGSITVYTDANGEASVYVYSNTAGDATLKATSGSVSDTEAYTYDAAADDTGYEWVITAAEYVSAGSTFSVVAVLKDAFGNTVTTDEDGDNWVNGADAPSIDVSYKGPGLTVGTAPDATDDDGQLKYYVFLGSNDSGTGTVTLSYTTDGDVDVTEEVKFTIGAAPSVGTVNVGSFNGKLVVYAKNLDGKRISWKVGGNWGKAVAVGNTLNRFDRPTPKKGVTVSVQLYVDGVLKLTKSVLTR